MANQARLLPRDICVRFREVHIKNDRRDGGGHSGGFWRPPGSCDDFLIDADKDTGWHSWATERPFKGKRMEYYGQNLHKSMKTFDTATLFWNNETWGFLVVPYDCTVYRAQPHEWHPPTFENYQDSLWLVGDGLRDRYLSCPITDSWRDLLGPVYFDDGVRNINDTTVPTCTLAGKLSYLFGFVAFATKWDDIVAMIEESFQTESTHFYKPVYCRGRQEDQGLDRHRGLIVQVACQANNGDVERLKNWQKGHYGPMLASSPQFDKRALGFVPAHEYVQGGSHSIASGRM